MCNALYDQNINNVYRTIEGKEEIRLNSITKFPQEIHNMHISSKKAQSYPTLLHLSTWESYYLANPDFRMNDTCLHVFES